MTSTTELAQRIAAISDTIDDAARLFGEQWDSALVGGNPNHHAITSDHTQSVIVRAEDDSRHSSWLCDYLEAVCPGNIRPLLDALAAKDKQFAETEAELEREREKSRRVMSRIAELEFIRTSAGQVQEEYAEALGCASDNESILEAIDGLKDQVRTIDMSNSVLQAQLAARPEQQPVAEVRISDGEAVSLRWDDMPENGWHNLYLEAPAAQPVTVKRPETSCIGWLKDAIHEHDEKWLKSLTAAGITIAEGE